MSTKTIPAQTIKTCDSCGTVMTSKNSRQAGLLKLRLHVLDMQGSACADGSRELDLCDECLYHVTKSIDHVIEARRLSNKPTT